MPHPLITPGSHALASGLRGFRATTLRVRVTEVRDGLVWARTADLLDAGTPLVLTAAQVVPEPPAPGAARHAGGLVAFG